MCGIFGYFNFKQKAFKYNEPIFNALMKESFSRGKEASGAFFNELNGVNYIIKSDLDGRCLLKSKNYLKLQNKLKEKYIKSAIGHSRLATHGSQLEHLNNQPVVTKNKLFVMIHNGIITNFKELWAELKINEEPPLLDSKAFLEYFSYLTNKNSIEVSLIKLYSKIEGSASIAIQSINTNEFILSTNTGSLYYVFNEEKDSIFFASEHVYLKEIAKSTFLSKNSIKHLKPQSAIIISNDNLKLLDFKNHKNEESINRALETNSTIEDYSLNESKSNAKKLYTLKNSLEDLKKHDFNFKGIYNIKRCKKCILPITTPFLELDNKSVCNYCNEHIKIKHLGIDQLKKYIAKFKKNNGEPDCLAAFSGGRDSAYGLHFLKKELGLNPLAYTYDWGMVTDIARDNQARILGKLGIEHIVVSADITMKRKHIKENIKAWMKDPHLGMVPLFMEGDKQCEFFADKIMKKYNLPLMFFFRGNELEKDEFKTGHCGVKDADPGGVIHNLETIKKIKLFSFYVSRYLKNPSYFNSSFFDTSLGFFSTYIQPHNYLFLWHYVPWDEATIVNTLKNEYNWQSSDETISTWRTDDGTSAFYNYIYYQVQGFTENDSFRSRQIREGILDRETALRIVNEENKPRYKALQWYFDMVGLDGHQVLSVVDKMKKLY